MELTSLRFDTYKAVTLLKEQGFTKKQSEGIIKVIQDVSLSGVATQQDVQGLEKDIQEVRHEVQDVRTEIQDVRTEIQSSKNEMLKFQIIQTITIIGVMVALFQIF